MNSSTHTYLMDFLREMEVLIPPPAKCHHVICLSKFGSEDTGWEEKLTVQLNVAGTFSAFFVDEDDLNLLPKTLAAEIHRIHNLPGVPQFGVAPGQFVDSDTRTLIGR